MNQKGFTLLELLVVIGIIAIIGIILTVKIKERRHNIEIETSKNYHN